MARIIKILKNQTRYYDEYMVAVVQLEDGDEPYEIYIGGEVIAIHHKGRNKAYVIPPWQLEGQGRKTPPK